MVSPHRRGQGPHSGFEAKEKTKLYGLVLFFVLVLGAFLGVKLIPGLAPSKRGDEVSGGYGGSAGPIDVAVSQDEEGRPVFKHKALTPTEKRDLALDEQRGKLQEFVEAGKLMDSDLADSPEVLEYLVNRSVHEWQVTRVPEGLYRMLPESDVLFEPGPHRGAFASSFGQVIEILPDLPFAGRVDQVDKLYRALFRTAGGNVYHITQTSPIDREVGDWIQVYGLFYRTRPYDGTEEGQAAISLVLTKEIQKAYPPLVVTALDPEWASEVLEKTFEQANNTDERPFWLILNYVKNLGIEGYRKLRDAGEIEPELVPQGGTLARDLSRLTEKYRFRYVAALGKVIDPYPDILQHDNPGKIGRVDSAVLLQATQYFVRLVSPRPWSEYDFRMGLEYVRVEGIYYKRWMYVPMGRGAAREIPLVIVTDIIPVDRDESNYVPALQWALAGLAVGLVLFFLVLAFRDRKRLAAFRERQGGRRGERDPGAAE